MTAAIPKLDATFVAPFANTDPNSEFRTHLRPAEVTPDVRRRMATELVYEQVTWTVLIVSTSLVFSVAVVAAFLQRELPAAMQREALRPVVLAALFAITFLHCHYRRLRCFVSTAPVTIGLVVKARDPKHFDEASSLAVPRLLLRYIPRPAEEGSDELHHSADAHTLWAELDGFSARFERTVHAGDLVSLLYDPTDPQRVRVVEFESENRQAWA